MMSSSSLNAVAVASDLNSIQFFLLLSYSSLFRISLFPKYIIQFVVYLYDFSQQHAEQDDDDYKDKENLDKESDTASHTSFYLSLFQG